MCPALPHLCLGHPCHSGCPTFISTCVFLVGFPTMAQTLLPSAPGSLLLRSQLTHSRLVTTKQMCAHCRLALTPAAYCPLHHKQGWGLATSLSHLPGSRIGLQRWDLTINLAVVALNAEHQLLQMVLPPSLLSNPGFLPPETLGHTWHLSFSSYTTQFSNCFLCDITCTIPLNL